METSLHPRCIIGNGKNRFDYKRPENRPFFGGLFRYCQLSAKRGCWRTALEQAKLLLSFDPTGMPNLWGRDWTNCFRSTSCRPSYSIICRPIWKIRWIIGNGNWIRLSWCKISSKLVAEYRFITHSPQRNRFSQRKTGEMSIRPPGTFISTSRKNAR